MGTRSLRLGLKGLERDSDYSLQSNAEVKMIGALLTHRRVSMACTNKSLKESEHLACLGEDRISILKWILNGMLRCGKVSTGSR